MSNNLVTTVLGSTSSDSKATMATIESIEAESGVSRRQWQSKSKHQLKDSQNDKKLPFCHRFITNWLITDPKYYLDFQQLTKPTHNYQASNQSKYIYFLGGRWRSAKAKPMVIFFMLLIVLPAILFWIFEASWCWHHISPAVVIIFTYFWSLCLSFFIRAGVSDPGILPRNIHLPSSLKNGQINNPPQEYFNQILLPFYHDVKYGVTVKYCSTCHIWRPPRASHCGVCNSCVNCHDHHCVFLNNCVGSRNYIYFIWFLLTATIACSILITISFVHIFHYRSHPNSSIASFKESIKTHPVSLLLAIYGLLAVLYPFTLLLFHIWLTSQNLTTRDYLNHVRVDPTFKNVFDTGNILKNLYLNWLGKPRGTSLVRLLDEYIPGDIRFEKVDQLQTFE